MLQVFGSIQWIHMYVDPKCVLISWIFWKMYKNEILIIPKNRYNTN